ncbi:uncharacterized protein TRIREDRAFT_111494 [Trichoderma reesei QM6a]|jgi:hypothetical protein|uniref:Predicted protein n=2 Tax=Hypocrea jecorina TaxID=51453 RepID=G0RUR0_HYPJQ|nr:uncharacterized protein TRIREDRAFT_111494 [Trichoderma reesei QM6a]EGR45037.1 predicted protein [Trichoderma reesei QM6a]
MSNSSLYEQLPLPSEEQTIRVLSIEPGTKGTMVKASMFKLDLNDPQRPPYNTLSYTWGEPTIVDQIMVNSKPIGVGANLFQALQHIRSSESPIDIWIDAICINQTDNKEKAHQVSQMDLVYRLCEQVYIWLGCSEASSTVDNNPFALVEHFAANKHFHDLPGYYKDVTTGLWSCDTEHVEFTSMWKAFDLVASSPWWHRAWTVQEAVLPAKAVVIYGTWKTLWETFDLCESYRLEHLSNYSAECCGKSYEAVGVSRGFPMDQVMGYVASLKRSRGGAQGYKSFSDISFAFMNRQCFNPRDKIYSLLGFAGSAAASLYPDYTKEVSEVYTEAFRKMMEENDMSPRCLLGEGFNSHKFNLPSWVRDFSVSFDSKFQLGRAQGAYNLFKACGDKQGKLEWTDGKSLLAKGMLVDQVKAVATWVSSSNPDNLKEILDDWRRTCEDNGVKVSTEQRDEVFARVLCGEVTEQAYGQKLLEEDDIDLPNDAQWSVYLGEGNARALPRKYRIAIGSTIDRKVLYVTSSGRVGLSCPGITVGDEVWVVYGSNVPFILRRQSGAGIEHRLVGETYLHGVMHGRCVGDDDSGVDLCLV